MGQTSLQAATGCSQPLNKGEGSTSSSPGSSELSAAQGAAVAVTQLGGNVKGIH